MKENAFIQLLKLNQPILFDGAMGTMLNQRGVDFEACFDELNLTRPSLVAGIHRDYIKAGSQVIQTNTFGANRYKLARHRLEDKVAEINAAGVQVARQAIRDSHKDVLVAGDIGPLGVRLAPFGRVQPEQAREAFQEQAAALANAGVDLIIVETVTDLVEVCEAITAIRQVAPGLPIIASMAFTRDDRTLLGDDPGKVARDAREAGADVVGVNCSGGPNQILRILKRMRQAVPEAYFSVMPNAGWPEQVGGRIMYPAASAYFGEYALAFWKAGAKVIGGCCGTTPQHIAVMKQAILSAPSVLSIQDNHLPQVEREVSIAPDQQPTKLAQKLQHKQFVIAVEMDPPRGLSTHKLLAGASLLAESGADVINVADSPMAHMRMSPWAVSSLIQNQVGIETILHFPTRGRNLLRVQGDLLAAHALNVRNVFVVMGDPTAIGDYPEAMDNYDLVPSGLIKLIKQGFNSGVDHSGSDIGQPTTFFVGCALNLNPPDIAKEVKMLRRKIEAGSDFILTQPVYDPQKVHDLLQHYQDEYGPLEIPLLLGILPLASARHAAFLNYEVPGISIPPLIYRRMEQAEDGAKTGIQIALELIQQSQPWVRGVYLMPAFNRFDYVAEIMEAIR